MARFPCSIGNHFNRNRNHYAYVAVGSGNDFTRERLRLCPSHFAIFQDNLTQFEVPPEDFTGSFDWSANSDCVACLEPVDERGWQVFITCYPPNQERKDYWGKLHVDCPLPRHLTSEGLSPLAG